MAVERTHLLDALHRTQAWFDKHLTADPVKGGRD